VSPDVYVGWHMVGEHDGTAWLWQEVPLPGEGMLEHAPSVRIVAAWPRAWQEAFLMAITETRALVGAVGPGAAPQGGQQALSDVGGCPFQTMGAWSNEH